MKLFSWKHGGNRWLPYFPLEVRIKNEEEVYLRLDGIMSKEKAGLLLKKGVWLEESLVRKLAAKNAPLSLLGYMVVDEGKELAPVLEVIEQPLQILLRLEMQGKEVLIPLHGSTLIEIDHKNKQVIVNLPEGLLDVYLDLTAKEEERKEAGSIFRINEISHQLHSEIKIADLKRNPLAVFFEGPAIEFFYIFQSLYFLINFIH